MRILGKDPIVPHWQKVTVVSPEESRAVIAAIERGEIKYPQGLPLSVLPEDVQDRLRRGEQVAPEEIEPVWAPKDRYPGGPG